MSSIRKLYRSILLGLLIIIGVILAFIFLHKSRPTHGISSSVITTWLGFVARTLGVKIKTYGTALPEKTLFVSNHISWMDILVLGSLTPIHFLSKHEVKTMPVVGWLATRAGTLYIKRGRSSSTLDANIEIATALKQKHNALVFAEGTTTDGHIKKFHSRMMQSAINAHAMVQPIAIFYPLINPGTQQVEINPDTLFLKGTTAGESFNLITRAPSIDVEVHFLEPIKAAGKTRDELAQHAYEEVVDAIKAIKNEYKK